MGRADWWKSGDWNGICDVCGQKWKASEMLLRWDGLYVCPPDFEPRQPQDWVRGIPDQETPPWTRPPPPPVFIQICTLEGRSAVAGFAVAGCSIVGLVPIGIYDDTVPSDDSGEEFPPQLQFNEKANSMYLGAIL